MWSVAWKMLTMFMVIGWIIGVVKGDPAPLQFVELLYKKDNRGNILRPAEFNLTGSLLGLLPYSKPTACWANSPNTIRIIEKYQDSQTRVCFGQGRCVQIDDYSSTQEARLEFSFNRHYSFTTGIVTVDLDILFDSSSVGYFSIFFLPKPNTQPNAGFQWYKAGDQHYGQLYQYNAQNEFVTVTAPTFPANHIPAGKSLHFQFVLNLGTRSYSLKIDGTLWHQTSMGTGFSTVQLGFSGSNTGIVVFDNLRIRRNDQLLFDVNWDQYPLGKLNVPDSLYALWQNQPAITMTYRQIYDDYGCYRAVINPNDPSVKNETQIFRTLWSQNSFPIQPNRTYILAVVARCQFDRRYHEINLIMDRLDAEGKRIGGNRPFGLPHQTQGPDGWQRLEWIFTPQIDDVGKTARCGIEFFLTKPTSSDEIIFELADYCFIELPTSPLVPFSPGEGVTFPGGPGSLPMKVETNYFESSQKLVIQNTAGSYEFDKVAGILKVFQRIDESRWLASYKFSVPFTGLRVQKVNENHAVVVGTYLTVGIQCDGVIVVSPHQDVKIEHTSQIPGDWNRFQSGSGELIVEDDWGGYLMIPHIPLGTGRMARVQFLSPVDFLNVPFFDTKFRSQLSAGWKTQWELSPGERLFISVSPNRPYPWKESFTRIYFWTFMEVNPSSYKTRLPQVTDWVLWDFSYRTWGSSFGPEYLVIDENRLKAHISEIHAAGDCAAPYMSMWFYFSRDPQVFLNEVMRWKRLYNIDGIYSDGLPSCEWLEAYIMMRMLRDLFPSGPLVIHDSSPQTGNATRRFIHTYATYTLLGEDVPSNDGATWPYPRFVTSQFRKANCLGDLKGNSWDLGGTLAEALIPLVYNGRSHIGAAYTTHSPVYLPILNQLYQLWQQKGMDPFFYDRYYLPKSQELAGYEVGRCGMPIVNVESVLTGEVRITLSTWSQGGKIFYTTDGRIPTPSDIEYKKPILIIHPVTIRARTFKSNLEPSRVAIIPVLGGTNTSPNIESVWWTPDPPYRNQSVTFEAIATDAEGHSLSYTWGIVSGPNTNITFSPNQNTQASSTTASFSQVGEYVIRLQVTDQYGASSMCDYVLHVEELSNTSSSSSSYRSSKSRKDHGCGFNRGGYSWWNFILLWCVLIGFGVLKWEREKIREVKSDRDETVS